MVPNLRGINLILQQRGVIILRRERVEVSTGEHPSALLFR